MRRFLLFFLFGILDFSAVSAAALQLRLKITSLETAELEASYVLSHPFSEVSLAWESISYTSEVFYKPVGSQHLQSKPAANTVVKNMKRNESYRFCLMASEPKFDISTKTCSFMTVPGNHQRGQEGGFLFYMIVGPVYSRNATISWFKTPPESTPNEPSRNTMKDTSFLVEWRKVDGGVGHPGHASNVVSNTHFITGLSPDTRFEVCVSDKSDRSISITCEYFTTAEAVPGPPSTKVAMCYIHARGTHWRCDVTWNSPEKPNGKIKGYIVEWRDEEGFTLHQSTPRGTMCKSNSCFDEQILNFHPFEVCILAKTAVGTGWESCTKVEDVRTRIMAFFELRILIIILTTILLYQMGPKFILVLLRFCIRTLYKRMEAKEKKHPV